MYLLGIPESVITRILFLDFKCFESLVFVIAFLAITTSYCEFFLPTLIILAIVLN